MLACHCKLQPPDEIAIITEGHEPVAITRAARDQRREVDAHAGLNDIRRSGQVVSEAGSGLVSA